MNLRALQNDIDETWVKIKESVNEAIENLQVLGSKLMQD